MFSSFLIVFHRELSKAHKAMAKASNLKLNCGLQDHRVFAKSMTSLPRHVRSISLNIHLHLSAVTRIRHEELVSALQNVEAETAKVQYVQMMELPKSIWSTTATIMPQTQMPQAGSSHRCSVGL